MITFYHNSIITLLMTLKPNWQVSDKLVSAACIQELRQKKKKREEKEERERPGSRLAIIYNPMTIMMMTTMIILKMTEMAIDSHMLLI